MQPAVVRPGVHVGGGIAYLTSVLTGSSIQAILAQSGRSDTSLPELVQASSISQQGSATGKPK